MLLVATVTAATPVGGREPPARSPWPPVHPSDDTEVFTGGEEVIPGEAPKRPAVGYWSIRATLHVPAAGRPVHVGLLVPLSDGRQDILARRATAPAFRFRETVEGPNLRAEWIGEGGVAGSLTYEVAVRIAESTATVPAVPFTTLVPPPGSEAARAPTPQIQSDSPRVVRRARAIIGRAKRLDEIVWSLYEYTAAFLPADDPPGRQDADSVLVAHRGTSLGRARALVALLRAAGVPARLVGGLRLGGNGTKRATNSWVEAWVGSAWLPLDPASGFFGVLPNDHLALYRDDVPLIIHTRGVELDYSFSIHPTTRRLVEEGADESDVRVEAGRRPIVRGIRREPVETHTAYVTEPVASVVLIADQSVPAAVTDRILAEARAAAIDCVLLTAHFESRYFRETYLEGLITANLPLVRSANLLLVATADDAGLYALMELGQRGIHMEDSRILVAGAMIRPAALMLGSLLYHLVTPGEVVLVPRVADLLPLWEMARANLIDGTPMGEEADRWNIEPLVLGETGERLPAWRRPIMYAWARAVRAQVPLGALTLILILPIIASLVVVARVVIVGLGVTLRMALQRLRLQAVSRLAILIALVAAVMAGLTLVGATLGIGPLLNISIFPMVIMSNVIENFAASQAELGTRQAFRMTATTLGLSLACYLVVDRGGLQSLVLAFPEILLATILFDVLLGKWRGLRLLEYTRFFAAMRHAPPVAAPAPRGELPRP